MNDYYSSRSKLERKYATAKQWATYAVISPQLKKLVLIYSDPTLSRH